MTNKQLAQRRAAATRCGKALVAKRGRADMAEIGRRSGKADFFDELRKAQALADEARRLAHRSGRRGST